MADKLRLVPINLRDANEFVLHYHRHHKPCTGQKFSVSVRDEFGLIHGVAICSRPVSRHLDDGFTLEVSRCCTDGSRNACSMLYSACCRAAAALGYHRVITYTLESEDGASLKASNFKCEGTAGGLIWTGQRQRDNGVPKEMKKRWVYEIRRERHE